MSDEYIIISGEEDDEIFRVEMQVKDDGGVAFTHAPFQGFSLTEEEFLRMVELYKEQRERVQRSSLRVDCCHGRTYAQCDGTCTDVTPCTPPVVTGNELERLKGTSWNG